MMRVLLYSECIDLLMIGFEWTLKGQALGQVQQQVQIINHGPVSNQNSQNGQTAMITQIQQSDHKVSWPSTLKNEKILRRHPSQGTDYSRPRPGWKRKKPWTN